MSKSDILAVFDQLIHQQPALASSIQPLLPRPSPSTFLLQLPILENNVLSCIPQQSRPEYVLSRVKTVLDNYVAEFRLALQSFNVASEHVSSAFTFLQSLTASLQRLQRALPPSNPSLATLVPNLFNAWHLFLSKVSSSVNVHGKILGADFVQRMFDDIQSLCDALPHQNHNPSDTSPTECHRFMHGVAERLNKEIGWLASRRSRDSTVEMEEL